MKATEKNKKRVLCTNTNQYFESISELSKKSKDLFGVHISRKAISSICNNKKENYNGYKFKFI